VAVAALSGTSPEGGILGGPGSWLPGSLACWRAGRYQGVMSTPPLNQQALQQQVACLQQLPPPPSAGQGRAGPRGGRRQAGHDHQRAEVPGSCSGRGVATSPSSGLPSARPRT